jgi:hypothetical protein
MDVAYSFGISLESERGVACMTAISSSSGNITIRSTMRSSTTAPGMLAKYLPFQIFPPVQIIDKGGHGGRNIKKKNY